MVALLIADGAHDLSPLATRGASIKEQMVEEHPRLEQRAHWHESREDHLELGPENREVLVRPSMFLSRAPINAQPAPSARLNPCAAGTAQPGTATAS